MNSMTWTAWWAALSVLVFSFSSLTAQVLEYDTKITIEKGKKITEKRYRILVKDKSDIGWADIDIFHDQKEKFQLIHANVVSKRGKVERRIKNKDIITTSNLSHGSFYQDGLVESFKLHWNEYPYEIDYAYKIEEKEFLYLTRWMPLVSKGATTLKASLMVEIPNDYEVIMKYDSSFQMQEKADGDTKKWTWTAVGVSLEEDDYFAPSAWEFMPQVAIAPAIFKYGVAGSNSSWESFGDWQIALNEGADELPLSEQQKVDELLAGIATDREKVRHLYHYLQDHTKYVNVSIDVGGLKSYPASYVCENKYGDCKALTTYMRALLKYAGIPAYYTLINSGSNAVAVDPNFTGTQFNHVILMVPLENDTIWLENTSSINPFNYLGTFTQDRWALKVDAGKSELIRTPALQSEDVLNESRFHFKLEESGEGQVVIDRMLRNNQFEKYNYYDAHEKREDQEEMIEDDVEIKHFELNDWRISKANRDRTFIEVHTEGDCKKQFRTVGSLKALQLPGFELPNLKKPEEREQLVQVRYPIHIVDSMMYDLPFLNKYSVELPDAINIDNTFGTFDIKSERRGDHQIVVERRFYMPAGRYPVEEYEQLYDFFKTINKRHKQFVVILKDKT
ncbi:MAG: transglutaminase domain-containing protein [Bacteroidota bacterium]